MRNCRTGDLNRWLDELVTLSQTLVKPYFCHDNVLDSVFGGRTLTVLCRCILKSTGRPDAHDGQY